MIILVKYNIRHVCELHKMILIILKVSEPSDMEIC